MLFSLLCMSHKSCVIHIFRHIISQPIFPFYEEPLSQHILPGQQPNQIIVNLLAAALFFSTGMLIGPIRLALAELHRETLIYRIWCEKQGGSKGLAGIGAPFARKTQSL